MADGRGSDGKKNQDLDWGGSENSPETVLSPGNCVHTEGPQLVHTPCATFSPALQMMNPGKLILENHLPQSLLATLSPSSSLPDNTGAELNLRNCQPDFLFLSNHKPLPYRGVHSSLTVSQGTHSSLFHTAPVSQSAKPTSSQLTSFKLAPF